MSYLISDCITEARRTVQDTDEPYRHSDNKLIGYFNNALQDVHRLRPDLFLGNLQQKTFYSSLDLGVDFPIDAGYFTSVVDNIAAQVGMEDDEFANDGRAMTLYQRCIVKLTGKFA